MLLRGNRSLSCMFGIVTRRGARPSGVGIPMGLRDFFFSKSTDRLWGPSIHLCNVYRGTFSGLMWPGCEPLLLPRLRTRGAIPPLPLYVVLAWTGKPLPLQGSAVCVVYKVRTGNELVYLLAGQPKDRLSILRSFQTDCGAHPRSYSVGSGVLLTG
jgi:hypothetical protein